MTIFNFLFQQQAASTTIYVATANELTGVSGQYFNNCFFCEPSKLAQNNEMVDSLWQVSEQILDRILQEKGLKWKKWLLFKLTKLFSASFVFNHQLL